MFHAGLPELEDGENMTWHFHNDDASSLQSEKLKGRSIYGHEYRDSVREDSEESWRTNDGWNSPNSGPTSRVKFG